MRRPALAGLVPPMNHLRIQDIDATARANFTYLADPQGADTWRSYADQARAAVPWEGDCDDLVSTVLDLLGRAGLPLEQRFRLVVRPSGSPDQHMIGMAVDDGGQFWIVGDTEGPIYPADACTYAADVYQRLSERFWRAGFPWERQH